MADTDAAAAAFIAALEGTGQRHAVDTVRGRVVWRRFGDGPPLVLLHGGHGSWLHWARNIGPLARHFTVWVPDLPGYGESDLPPELTLESLVDSTRAALDTLVAPGTAIHLVGFSFGGIVAASLTARRGAVRQLALLGTAGHGGPRRPRGVLRLWRDAAERRDDAALAEVMRHNLLQHMLHEAAAVDALALRIQTLACLRTRFRSKPISRSGGLGALLDAHRGPLLLRWGEHDVTSVPEHAAMTLSAGRAHCNSGLVAGAGHWVQYESAECINANLLEWLGGSGGR
jgi:pimeloyl-ACP methyl ester carboxylesterase